jgi:hypothetical protein
MDQPALIRRAIEVLHPITQQAEVSFAKLSRDEAVAAVKVGDACDASLRAGCDRLTLIAALAAMLDRQLERLDRSDALEIRNVIVRQLQMGIAT